MWLNRLMTNTSATDVRGPALETVRLTKHFGHQTALHDVSFAVPQGAIFGLVGPNGAGKTTAMSMMSGLLRPTHGTAMVLGHDMWAQPQLAKAALGVLPDGVRLFDRLSGPELVQYHGRLRGLTPDVASARTESLLDVLQLADVGAKLVCDYSAGMTKKIALACALVHAPKVLLLDEPLEAVDPVSAQRVRDVLAQFSAGGGTVVFSSHVMELVEAICDHVAVLAQGRLLAVGTTEAVCAGVSLQERFVTLVGRGDADGELSWLHS